MKVNIPEAKNQLSRLIGAASRGEDVVIAKRGVPVARLVPVGRQPSREDVPGQRAGNFVEWLASPPLRPTFGAATGRSRPLCMRGARRGT